MDIETIKTEPAGYGSKSTPITASRSYPNLSDADTQYLPKTIEDGGRTLTLQDVQWQADNTHNADDYEIGDRFAAVCTYGGTIHHYRRLYRRGGPHWGDGHALHRHLQRHPHRAQPPR